jgi:hypothetical protein
MTIYQLVLAAQTSGWWSFVEAADWVGMASQQWWPAINTHNLFKVQSTAKCNIFIKQKESCLTFWLSASLFRGGKSVRGSSKRTGENWSAGRRTLYSVGGRWMDEYGAMVEWHWQGRTEVMGEKRYTGWVVDEWMRMEQWWNDTDGKAEVHVQKRAHKSAYCLIWPRGLMGWWSLKERE